MVMSYKILFISPHLSTGGCPQYLLKKIQLLNPRNDVYCVEYHNHGEWFNIQKSQVRTLLGSKYYTLGDDKKQIFSIIEKINPQIIHIEEMPEYFMDKEIADVIYKNDRKYNIIETSHDSSFDPSTKRHFPDRFVFVSEYQKRNVEKLNIPSHVVEYPIPINERTNRDETLTTLGLDPKLFHVLNVGLFSPRKNQAEIIEYARKLVNHSVQFHFIGNQAGNFQTYWEPLLKNLPSNCKLWGERSDVNTFFSCMDLFLFTSRGHANDKETSPIVIREALSYKIPSLIYNLPVYLGMYDKYPSIKYLADDLDNNLKTIRSYLPVTVTEPIPTKFAYIVSSYPNTDVAETTTVNCLRSLVGHKILTTHYKDHEKFESIADDVIFDVDNPIIKHSFYSNYWSVGDSFRIDLNLKFANNNSYHGLAVWTNYQNGIRKSKELGYKYSVCLNYDMILGVEDLSVVHGILSELEASKKRGYFMYEKAAEGDTLKTVFFVIENDFFLESFDEVRNEQQYNVSISKNNSPSNSLENYIYSCLKSKLSELIVVNKNERELLPNSDINLFSCVEYFSVVPVKNENKFVIWKNTYNVIDHKNLLISLFENNKLVSRIGYVQSETSSVYGVFDFNDSKKYGVVYEEYNGYGDRIKQSNIKFDNKSDIDSAGLFDLLNTNVSPNIKTNRRYNLHHFDINPLSNTSILSLTSMGFIYRSYNNRTEIDILKSLSYYLNDHHLFFNNVELVVDLDVFYKKLKTATEYMYDNNLLLISFVPSSKYVSDKTKGLYQELSISTSDAYLINNNYLKLINESIDKNKTNDSVTLFNNNLSHIKKGFSADSLIKIL